MDEGQVVRWKDGLSETGGLLHDHTSDQITHKTLAYYLLWDQMDPTKSRVMLMRCHHNYKKSHAIYLPIIYHINVIYLIYPLPIDRYGIDGWI